MLSENNYGIEKKEFPICKRLGGHESELATVSGVMLHCSMAN